MAGLYKTSENTWLTFASYMVSTPLPLKGAHIIGYGLAPICLSATLFCPCKERIIHNEVELCAPYRGKFCGKYKRRGKPLRYTMSSLRDFLSMRNPLFHNTLRYNLSSLRDFLSMRNSLFHNTLRYTMSSLRDLLAANFFTGHPYIYLKYSPSFTAAAARRSGSSAPYCCHVRRQASERGVDSAVRRCRMGSNVW